MNGESPRTPFYMEGITGRQFSAEATSIDDMTSEHEGDEYSPGEISPNLVLKGNELKPGLENEIAG